MVNECAARPGGCTPPPPPPVGACTAAVFNMPGLADVATRNPDCDSYATIMAG